MRGKRNRDDGSAALGDLPECKSESPPSGRGTPRWNAVRDVLCPPVKPDKTSEYPCGDAEDHRRSLAERIGYPNLCNIMDGMRNEHCLKTGCEKSFKPRNYPLSTTTPKAEWRFVVEGQSVPQLQMASGRRRISIDELMQLPLTKSANLRVEEVIGIVLYTGPMYEIYNCILNQRNHPADSDKLWDTYQHNRFPTTLWAIVSAVQKLGASTPLNLGEKLYRGNGGSQWLPGRFVDRDDLNVRGMTAPLLHYVFVTFGQVRGMTALSFQSFSASMEKALEYAKPDGPLPMVFVIQPSVDPLNGFADIAQFSQNPDERERVLPPLAWFYPDSTCASYRIQVPHKGTVEFVPIRVTACRSPCLEELERRKQNMHITEFGNRVAELQEALQNTARKGRALDRLQSQNEQTQMRYWDGKEHSVDTFIASIVKKVDDVVERHRNIHFSEFNKKRYVAIVQESLDCLRMAPSVLKLWLMDETQHIHLVTNYSLLQGHRGYINFLKRKYHESDPDNRQNLARKLCKHLRLFLDTNDLSQGETPLMNAAEFGRTEEALEYLIASGENIHATKDDGESCLHLAADNGHDHCIRALLRLGAAIDHPKKTGFTALHCACNNAHRHCIATLASFKADVNKRCSDGRTALFHAAQRGGRGHVECIEELVRHGANLDQCDSNAFTPLYIACQNGKKMCVAALLALGAKVNLDLPMLTSPLWAASKSGHFEVVKEFKSVPHAVLFPPELLSPLTIAISSKQLACVEALLQLQPPAQYIFNALLAAIWFRDLASIRLILDAGAIRGLGLLQARDEDGLTPEQFAESCCCNQSELELLRSSGGALARANASSAISPLPIFWNVPRKSVCVTLSSTLRFYSYATARARYGCRGGDCAYFEITLRHSGRAPQFGLCSDRFSRHEEDYALRRVPSNQVEGVGDCFDSWAVDGIRSFKWHKSLLGGRQEWGVKWGQGDVIGIACNMLTRQMLVSLNGDYKEPNGVVFDLPHTALIMYPALFSSDDCHVHVNLGHAPFKHAHPSQVCEARRCITAA